MSESIQLHLLRPGQRAVIVKINGNGALRRRFVEMGIVKGETILFERHAPLGDPVEYFIKGYHLALRKEEAAHIEVSVDHENAETDPVVETGSDYACSGRRRRRRWRFGIFS
ncbi:ferrous iron transport protein A [Chloroflexi bacterium CFX6]|nr:ferrous iron transport protein A [Chloroflexi bacterium CFX6]